MTLPGRGDWLFAAKTLAAALLALYIALALGLPRPYWAMSTVYIVANPLTGATRSRALYRAGGTLIGACAAVALVPALVDLPVLLCLAVSLWTGTLLYLSLLDRSPASYVFRLAAYTLPMVALPSVMAPLGVFEAALARSEEILVGITCASVVAAIAFPTRVADVLGLRIGRWLDDAARWIAPTLVAAQPDPGASRHTLAMDILALDQLVSYIAYDSSCSDSARLARLLRVRLAMIPPLQSSLESTLTHLRGQPGGVPPALAAELQAVAEWMACWPRQDFAARGEALRAQPGEPAAAGSWTLLLQDTLRERLRSLVALWLDCVALHQLIAADAHGADWQPRWRRWKLRAGPRVHDHALLLFTAASTSLGIFLGCLAWINSGWGDGVNAVILGSVACCLFAAVDEPAPLLRSFFTWTVVSIVVAAVLLFAVLPAAHDFATLAALLAVPFLLFGTVLAHPRLNLIAMPLAVNVATFVGVDGVYQADFAAFFNANVAGAAGLLMALLWTLLVRPFGAGLALRRLVSASWRDLARTAAGRHRGDPDRLAARMVDRLDQLLPRLAASTSDRLTDGFRELRVGFNALILQRARARLLPAERRAVDLALLAVSAHFRACARAGHWLTLPPRLGRRLVKAIDGLAAGGGESARAASHALVDVQLALMPPPAAAAAPTPRWSEAAA